ncbi:MAG: hypothetical protein WD273_05510 [Trueperaceae bacterium]
MESKYFVDLDVEAQTIADDIEACCESTTESAVLVRYGYQVDALRPMLPDW